MKLTRGTLSGLAIVTIALTGASTRRLPMDLGNFSVSLTVKNLDASKVFYEKLGFVQVLGDASKGWVIMKNGNTNIGLFHGMFDRNILTFNPGWDQNGKPIGKATDVRNIQTRLRDEGIAVGPAIEGTHGPAGFTISDPDGNPILIDQHI